MVVGVGKVEDAIAQGDRLRVLELGACASAIVVAVIEEARADQGLDFAVSGRRDGTRRRSRGHDAP